MRRTRQQVIARTNFSKPLMEFHQHKIHIRLKNPPPRRFFPITINGRCSMDFPLSREVDGADNALFFNGAVSCGSFNVKLALPGF